LELPLKYTTGFAAGVELCQTKKPASKVKGMLTLIVLPIKENGRCR
jgi:hypothetical protein